MPERIYNYIFFTNVLRLLDKKNMTKFQLREKAELSAGVINDVTLGRGNPSLKTMEQIAVALDTPLSVLLETDLDKRSLELLTEGKIICLPEGYVWVSAILPARQAFIVNKWAEAAKEKLDNALTDDK